MINIRLYNPIANKHNAWWYSWDGEDGVFSLDFVQKVFSDNPNETDFRFNIHCAGGEVEEGLAIYDWLRTSGKNIYMNIEGGCHSMAVTLLLAAPAENRSCNPNAVALIHEVQGYAAGSATAVSAEAHNMQVLQDRILDIYAERTGGDRSSLEAIMKEGKEHNAKELLALGFVSKINAYNTNFKLNNFNMAEKTLLSKAANCLSLIKNLLGGKIVDYDFVDDEGNVLFSTEGEDDTLEVGMAASPDGTFTIADGRTVTIADGVITEITEAEPEEQPEPEEEETDSNSAEERLAICENALAEAYAVIRDLKKQVKSNYVPAGRVKTPGKKTNAAPSREDRKAELRENVKLTKSK